MLLVCQFISPFKKRIDKEIHSLPLLIPLCTQCHINYSDESASRTSVPILGHCLWPLSPGGCGLCVSSIALQRFICRILLFIPTLSDQPHSSPPCYRSSTQSGASEYVSLRGRIERQSLTLATSISVSRSVPSLMHSWWGSLCTRDAGRQPGNVIPALVSHYTQAHHPQ